MADKHVPVQNRMNSNWQNAAINFQIEPHQKIMKKCAIYNVKDNTVIDQIYMLTFQ